MTDDEERHPNQRNFYQKSLFSNQTTLNNIEKIRELFRNEKIFLNALQPNNRSFSLPELKADLVSHFTSFRERHLVPPNTQPNPSSASSSSSNEDKTSNGCRCNCSNGQRSEITFSENDSDESTPPIPSPRKSVLRRREHKNSKEKNSVLTAAIVPEISSDCPPIVEDTTLAGTELSVSNGKLLCANSSSSLILSPNSNANGNVPTVDWNNSVRCNSSLESTSCKTDIYSPSSDISLPSRLNNNYPLDDAFTKPKMPIKVKAKPSFRQQLMRINKLASNKFLSLRLKDSLSRRKPFFGQSSDSLSVYKARRPTRLPPPPPILVFRPAAPSPPPCEFDHEDHTSIEANGPKDSNLCNNLEPNSLPQSTTNYDGVVPNRDCDNISELYHDAFNGEDIESLYCSVDEITSDTKNRTKLDNQFTSLEEVDEQQSSEQERRSIINSNPDASNNFHGYDETAGEDNDYYDDGECIYEELSSNEGTIYEEYLDEDDENVYDNADAVSELEPNPAEQKKQIKRLKKAQKMMRRFHMSGDEIPINAGIVKQDRRGSKSELPVRQGETVLILRMENNPPGKWLAKDERSKIGYVDLENVYFDTESIKAAIQSFHNITPS